MSSRYVDKLAAALRQRKKKIKREKIKLPKAIVFDGEPVYDSDDYDELLEEEEDGSMDGVLESDCPSESSSSESDSEPRNLMRSNSDDLSVGSIDYAFEYEPTSPLSEALSHDYCDDLSDSGNSS